MDADSELRRGRLARERPEDRREKLERRYRCLMVLYPADHRREHGEEMLNVLLDQAVDVGLWEDAADAADFVSGAARLRYRSFARVVRDPDWPLTRVRSPRWADALAIASLVFPVALLAMAAGALGLPQDIATGTAAMGTADYLAFWPLAFGAPATALLALLGARRGTAVAALATTLCLLAIIPQPWADPAAALAETLGAVAGVASLLSRGPRRGMSLVRWWGITLAAVGAVLMASLTEDSMSLYPGSSSFPVQGLWTVVMGSDASSGTILTSLSVVVFAGAACACLRTPAGRRFLPLLAIPAIPYALLLRDDLSPTIIPYLSATPVTGQGTWNSAGWICLAMSLALITMISVAATVRPRSAVA